MWVWVSICYWLAASQSNQSLPFACLSFAFLILLIALSLVGLPAMSTSGCLTCPSREPLSVEADGEAVEGTRVGGETVACVDCTVEADEGADEGLEAVMYLDGV